VLRRQTTSPGTTCFPLDSSSGRGRIFRSILGVLYAGKGSLHNHRPFSGLVWWSISL